MKILLLALIAILPFAAMPADAKMTHKWDEEHYAQGHFRVKKHDYPRSKDVEAPPPATRADERIKIDHKGKLYRESEFPPPRHPVPKQ